MDGAPQQTDQPKQQHPLSFLQEMEWTGGGILLGIVFFLIVFLVLNYFNILRLSSLYPNQLGFLPHRPYLQQNVSLNPTQPIPTPTPSKITLSCPVPKEFCNSGKYLIHNGNSALAYNLPSGTNILSIAPVVALTQVTTSDAGTVLSRTVRQTYLRSADCYTVSYILSPDASVKKFDLLPLPQGEILATVGATLIKTDEQEANLILQLQKRVVDPTLIGKPDFEQCSAKNVNPKQIGVFQPVETMEME